MLWIFAVRRERGTTAILKLWGQNTIFSPLQPIFSPGSIFSPFCWDFRGVIDTPQISNKNSAFRKIVIERQGKEIRMIKVTLDFWSTQTQQLLKNLKNLTEKCFWDWDNQWKAGVGWVGYRQQRGAACQTEDSPPLQYLSKRCKLYSRIIIFGPNMFFFFCFYKKNMLSFDIYWPSPPSFMFFYKMYLRPLSKGVKDKEAYPPPVFDKFPCWSTFESRKLLSSYKLLIQRKLST